MWIITYKGKPATLWKIREVEHETGGWSHDALEYAYLCAPSKKKAIAHFLHYIGYEWGCRTSGVECQKVSAL